MGPPVLLATWLITGKYKLWWWWSWWWICRQDSVLSASVRVCVCVWLGLCVAVLAWDGSVIADSLYNKRAAAAGLYVSASVCVCVCVCGVDIVSIQRHWHWFTLHLWKFMYSCVMCHAAIGFRVLCPASDAPRSLSYPHTHTHTHTRAHTHTHTYALDGVTLPRGLKFLRVLATDEIGLVFGCGNSISRCLCVV